MCLGLLKRTSSECVQSGLFCHTRGSGSKTRASSASRRAASVGGVRGRRPAAASSGSVPHRVASAGRGEASLDIVLGDDRSRAGRTGPKGEDFGDHGGSRIGVSFGTVLEAVVAACLRRKASEAVREGALAG